MRQAILAQYENAPQVDRDSPVEDFLGNIDNVGVLHQRDAVAVSHRGDPAESRGGLIQRPLDVLGARNVGRRDKSLLLADAVQGLLQALFVDVDQRDFTSFSGKYLRGTPADPRRRSRDNRNLVFESHWVWSPAAART